MKEKTKIEKDFICPIAAGADPWEAECKHINDFYCWHASLAHHLKADKENLPQCPYDPDPEHN